MTHEGGADRIDTHIASRSYINPLLPVGNGLQVGLFSCVGYDDDNGTVGSVGDHVIVATHAVISLSARIASNVTIDSYCRVGRRTTIGVRTELLYGAQIFDDCHIGCDCVVAGEIPNRVVIEDCVTFMGDIAHTYRDATVPWEVDDEPSPVVKRGSVVGMRALVIGDVAIGPRAYVAAGEIVRHDIPADTVLYRGELSDIRAWRGALKAREAAPSAE
jgi:serine acetyltransferase